MAQEIEAKFYIRHPDALKERLDALGAELSEPRVLEFNLRFDTTDGQLRRSGRVLRLRRDTRARLTYKDSDRVEAGALNRREVEFTVSDFDAAKEFIEALGYGVALIYEKYRSTYKLGETEIMMDEMPYGHFIEIEGHAESLRPIAEALGLDWDVAIPDSYSVLFERLRHNRKLNFRDLTFENLRAIEVLSSDLGVRPADE